MNKTEMAEKLAKKCDLSQAKALEIVSCIFDTKAGAGIIASSWMAAARSRFLASAPLAPSIVPPGRVAIPLLAPRS